MFQRDRQPEQMDDPQLPRAEHDLALAGLARLNRVSGVAGSVYRRLRGYVASGEDVIRVLDLASGAGDVPIAWAKWARAEGLSLRLTMLDISEVAVEEQYRRAHAAGISIDAAVHDCLTQPLPSGFDVVTCSLFMHHLDDHQVVKMLQSMHAASRRAILISDLSRSRTNLALVGIGARLLSRSSVVHCDALRSVRGAYTKYEFQALAEQALLRPVCVETSFPCRFIACIDEQTESIAVPAFA